jgi:hypothetical protein
VSIHVGRCRYSLPCGAQGGPSVSGAHAWAHHWPFGFTKEIGGDDPLSLRFPSENLDMLNGTISDEPRDAPHDLSRVLDTIVEAEPALEVKVRSMRLADIAARR